MADVGDFGGDDVDEVMEHLEHILEYLLLRGVLSYEVLVDVGSVEGEEAHKGLVVDFWLVDLDVSDQGLGGGIEDKLLDLLLSLLSRGGDILLGLLR